MNRLFRVLAAGATTLPLLVACGGAPSSGLNLQGEGSIEVALTSAPNDASCLRLTIDTSRNSLYLFDLIPGTSTSSYRINRLPVGRATVDAQAFPVSCSKVASFTGEPLFVSEVPVAVRIDPSDVNSVLLKLVRNGRLNVGIDFDNRVSPYLVGIAPGVVFKDLITVGDSINGYRMAGIPDGLGAFDNADGSDSHVFTADNPLAAGDLRYGVATAVPNFSRVTVQGSTTAPLTEWLRLKVDASSASVFSWERNPR